MMKERPGKAHFVNKFGSLIFAGFCLPVSLLCLGSGERNAAPIFRGPEVVETREALSFNELLRSRPFRADALTLLEEVELPVFTGIENNASGTDGMLSTVQCACNCTCNCFCNCHCHK